MRTSYKKTHVSLSRNVVQESFTQFGEKASVYYKIEGLLVAKHCVQYGDYGF